MIWLCQNFEYFREKNWLNLIEDQCKATGHEFYSFDIIPFDHKVVQTDLFESLENQTNIVFYGATLVSKIQEQYKFSPGIFPILDEYETRELFGSHYLNYDMKLMHVDEVLEYAKENDLDFFFVKPVSDIKMFDGGIFDQKRFPFFLERIKQLNNFDSNVKACVSSIKEISEEYRFFVVNKKIVSGSLYRKNLKLSVDSYIPSPVTTFTEYLINSYKVPDIFVIDICKLQDGSYKVIELNTMNFSGFYSCDVRKIVEEINEFYTS